jgi:hypothetical protein
MNLYVAGDKVGVSIEKADVEDAFSKFGKLGAWHALLLLERYKGAADSRYLNSNGRAFFFCMDSLHL